VGLMLRKLERRRYRACKNFYDMFSRLAAASVCVMNRDPVQRNCSAELHQRPASDVTHGAADALRPWRHLLVCARRTSV